MDTGRGFSQVPAGSLDVRASDCRPDVVVVGARVGGAATALHLARAGHEVLVVDRSGPPTDTISTHALFRSGVLQLHRAGVLDRIIEMGTTPIRQVGLVFGDERVSFPVTDEFGVDSYFAPRRTVLDTVILNAAIEAGARFLTGVSATGVVRDDRGRVAGLMARTSTEEIQIRARHVVGADGTHSRIARAAEAPVLAYFPPTNAIVYAYFQGLVTSGYDFRFINHRNVGVIPTNDGLALVFVGGPLVEAPLDGEQYLFTTLRRVASDLADAVASADRVGRLHRASGVPTLLRDPAGPGWSLVGDAGFTEDPISAHGITDALRDADLCAAAIDISLRDSRSEGEAMTAYRKVRDTLALPLIENTVRLASFDWDEPEASRLLLRLGDIAEAECRLLEQRPVLSSVLA